MFLVTSSLLQLANVFEAEMNANPLHIEHKTILEIFKKIGFTPWLYSYDKTWSYKTKRNKAD